LTLIDLNRNNIGDDGATALAKALLVNESLTSISLDDNKISNQGATALAKALHANKSLTMIDLDRNKISDEGATALAEALQVNESLTKLYLTGNNIGDKGATALAEALQVNTSLQELIMHGCNVGDEGAMRLLETLENHNGTLVFLSLSHVLESSINELVNANENGTRNPRPCPRPKRELYIQAAPPLNMMDSHGNTKLQEGIQRLHRNDASLKMLNLRNEGIGDESDRSARLQHWRRRCNCVGKGIAS
jgi:hypothetical protein